MHTQRRKLPMGMATFAEVIGKGCYYVDKTPFARQLLQHGKYFFLSRPRRFGKSLFIDTLKELFEGNAALFSGLNDITLDPRYSSLCGYTDADVTQVFAPELAGLDRAEIGQWYNGYNWLGEPVYNPYDLLLLFDKRKFAPYWFESGTPGFLIQTLTERQTWLPTLEAMHADVQLL